MLRAILFDLGGTLFDSANASQMALFNQAARDTYRLLTERGHKLPSYWRYYRFTGWTILKAYGWSLFTRRDFSVQDLTDHILQKLGLNVDDATRHEVGWKWYEPATPFTTVSQTVIPALEKLRARGLKLALVSNTIIPAFALDRHLAQHGLLDFFPVRVYSSELGHRKPHAAIFEYALSRVGVRPEEALFVGDKLRNDVWGARRVGMKTVLRKPNSESRTHPLADFVVREVSELVSIIPMFVTPTPNLSDVEEELAMEG